MEVMERPRLAAPAGARQRYETVRKSGGFAALVRASGMVEQRLPPVRKAKTAPVVKGERPGDPTPERVAKVEPGMVRETPTPPYTVQIQAVYHKYQKRLLLDELIALDTLYEMGARATVKNGLTTRYDGSRVDVSTGGFQHLSDFERDAHEAFRAVWERLAPGLRLVAFDLVFEGVRGGRERALTLQEVGNEISGYRDEGRAVGAGFAALRVLSWQVAEILGNSRQRKKTGSRVKSC